jgi:hypothetical protein
VQYTRKVFKGAQLVKNERYTVRYDPQNAIVELGPPKKAKPKAGAKPAKPEPVPPADGTTTSPAEQPAEATSTGAG